MKVRNIREQIELMKSDYENMIRLTQYFSGQLSVSKETVANVASKLENGANLSTPLELLCSMVSSHLDKQIKHLEAIIDNIEVDDSFTRYL